MKKLYLTIMISILLIGIVSAGIGIGVSISKSREISEVYRDELLTQVINSTEVNPEINIKCNNEYCLWSASQEGIINSHNNRFSKNYCDTHNETTGDCISYTDYTNTELQDMVADKVQSRLENYANASIERKADVVTDFGTGTVTITEKK